MVRELSKEQLGKIRRRARVSALSSEIFVSHEGEVSVVPLK